MLCLCISPMAAEAILTATTMGADRTSEFAIEEVLDCLEVSGRWMCEHARGVASLVSFWTRSTNLPRGYPEAGAQISTLSCLTVSASRKKVYPSVFPRRSHRLLISTPLVSSTGSKTKLSSTCYDLISSFPFSFTLSQSRPF